MGFRPFVHGLAERLGLSGWVRNDPDGVFVEIEGEPARLDDFLKALRDGPPALAEVESIEARPLRPRGSRGFRIVASREGRSERTPLPPDAASCPECLRELRDPADRRHGYPFLNCTRCGPRFTIVRSVPYDRARTTMSDFVLCDRCREECEDPTDRRFHAQPTACPGCGPKLSLLGADGRKLADPDPLGRVASALLHGRVVAVKGLGGFHLACDATSAEAVGRLRRRKARDRKPFAVMVPDLDAARRLCTTDPEEEALLTSVAAPVVLLRRREDPPSAAGAEHAAGAEDAAGRIAPGVAPENRYLGLMLPYTPLHHLLLERVGRPLVLTSGNRSGEPIACRNEDVVERLGGIADLFLVHDRPIRTRCDDSVLQVACGGPVPIRRSRGFVPRPLPLPVRASEPLLALGGHLKNTFCVAAGEHAHLSPHVGDLDDPEALAGLREQIAHLCSLCDVEPTLVVRDLHPDYATTRLADELEAEGLRSVAVQHHHAHVASCAAEHGHRGPVIGVAFDGSGYGPDGTVWGGEFLLASLSGFRRVGHLAPVLLPGGEAAVREPWRMALAHVRRAGVGRRGTDGSGDLGGSGTAEVRELFPDVDPERIEGVEELLRSGVASPPTSSVGRLFDAVAALVGIRTTVRFEAEAAMALEAAVDAGEHGSYPVDLVEGESAPWTWDPARIVHRVLDDRAAGTAEGRIAARFHKAVADAVVAGCLRARAECGVETVALTGGVFLNRILTERAVPALERRGFRVLLHRRTPPGDGGLSFGQAVVAAARLGGD